MEVFHSFVQVQVIADMLIGFVLSLKSCERFSPDGMNAGLHVCVCV